MTRAYLRLDPGFYERKAIEQHYPLPAVAALVGCLCLADSQPQRGTFRDERVLRILLGPAGRWLGFLLDRGDLIRDGSRIRVDGWHEWQEGDLTVADRMARLRNRKRNGVTPDSVTNGVTATVTPRLAEAKTVALDNSGGGAPSRAPQVFMSSPRGSIHDGRHGKSCLVCFPLAKDAPLP